MSHRNRTARALLTSAAAAVAVGGLLTSCNSPSTAPAGTAPASPTVHKTAPADPAMRARHTKFTQIQAQMNQAMTAAGLKAEAIVNLRPTGSLTSAKYCLNSFLLLVPNNSADQVATELNHSLQAAGWTPDPTAGSGTIALDHGDWTATLTHQTSGIDKDPTTGKIRTGAMSFFQAKNNTFDCS